MIYKLLTTEILGEGRQGAVFLTCKGEDKSYATKIPVNDDEIKVSKIMSKNKLGPKLYEIYDCKTVEDTKKITFNGEALPVGGKCMVMERLIGADLAHIAQDEDIFISEEISNLIIKKIRKFHKLGWHHGDLFAQNIFIILDKCRKPIDIKIIDFGHVKELKKVNYVEDFNDLLTTLKIFGENNMENLKELVSVLEREIVIRTKTDKNRIKEKILKRVKKRKNH